MICDECAKRRTRNKHGVKYHDCAVLKGPLPAWGDHCAARSNNTAWEADVKQAVDVYQYARDRRSLDD